MLVSGGFLNGTALSRIYHHGELVFEAGSAPEWLYDPTTNPKLQAMYSSLEPGSDPAQWADLSGHARHATKIGAVYLDSDNAVAGGFPAWVFPPAPVADQGFLLPGMTIREMVMVFAYGNGTETTWGGKNGIILSGLSGNTGTPVTMYNQSNNQHYTTMGALRYSPETPVNGLPKSGGTVLPLPMQVQNFRFGSNYTETGWKFGYRDDNAPTESLRGVMTMAFFFDALLTDEERYLLYSHINSKLNKQIPIPSWTFTRTELLIDQDLSDPTREGVPYFPTLVSMTSVPDFPFEWAIYASTDHVAASGIYMYVGNGDPADPSVLKSYNQAVADGDFDYIVSKPSVNPVFEYTTSGNSTETPHGNVINGKVVMTHQQASIGNGQSTMTIVSSDGVNFISKGVTVDYPAGSAPGDGHTGYHRWHPNPFAGLINPNTGLKWKYVGYSLHGGTIKSFGAQWVCEDPENEDWTRSAILMPIRGRGTMGYSVPTYGSIGLGWSSIDLSSVLPNGDGNYRALMTLSPQVAGGGGRINETYEVLLDSKGQQLMAMPQKVFARGAAASYDEYQVTDLQSLPYGGKKSIIYQATSTGDINRVAGAVTQQRAHDITKFYPLTPAIPSSLTTLEADFTDLGALPGWLTAVQVGTTEPTAAFSAGGLDISGTNAGAVPGQYYLFADPALIPNSLGFIEMEIEGLQTLSTNRQRVPLLGFASAKSIYSAQTDAFYLSNDLSTNGNLYKRQKIANAEQTAVASTYYYSLGYGTSTDNNAKAPKRLGIRYFPASGLCVLLGESGHEFETFTLSGSLNKAIGYYPFFGVQFKNTAEVERITKFRVRYGS